MQQGLTTDEQDETSGFYVPSTPPCSLPRTLSSCFANFLLLPSTAFSWNGIQNLLQDRVLRDPTRRGQGKSKGGGEGQGRTKELRDPKDEQIQEIYCVAPRSRIVFATFEAFFFP